MGGPGGAGALGPGEYVLVCVCFAVRPWMNGCFWIDHHLEGATCLRSTRQILRRCATWASSRSTHPRYVGQPWIFVGLDHPLRSKPHPLNHHQRIHTHTHPHTHQALPPSAQLDLIERVLVTLRAATEGGLMPGADGRKRHMSETQLRLVAVVQPEVCVYSSLRDSRFRLLLFTSWSIYMCTWGATGDEAPGPSGEAAAGGGQYGD